MAKRGVLARKKTARADDAWHCVAISIPRMQVFLVGGCHPEGQPAKWKLGSNVFGVTTSLRRATLFPFHPSWVNVARSAAQEIRRSLRGRQVPFVARVLAIGDPEAPTEVVPAWTLEGQDRPQDQRYHFDPPSAE
jgi:hypothetical protein